ncbi:MAG: hypothetical protein AAGA00_11285 [Pseudomonadota bacterium]
MKREPLSSSSELAGALIVNNDIQVRGQKVASRSIVAIWAVVSGAVNQADTVQCRLCKVLMPRIFQHSVDLPYSPTELPVCRKLVHNCCPLLFRSGDDPACNGYTMSAFARTPDFNKHILPPPTPTLEQSVATLNTVINRPKG